MPATQAKRQRSAAIPTLTIGLDLGDRKSRVSVIDRDGVVLEERAITTERSALAAWARPYPKARVVMEAGTHSPWVSRLLEEMGQDVIVANPSALYGGKRRKRRNDKIDAEHLARLGRVDPHLLSPVHHRGERAQADGAVLQARDALVRARTQLINAVRGTVKAFGERLPKCSAETFAKRVAEEIPPLLQPAFDPVIAQIAALTEQIQAFDTQVERKAAEYPETARVRQVSGVGPLTALAYVLVLEDAERFPHPRAVGSYLGLVPRLDESGDVSPQLRITKAGHAMLRRLLVQAAHYVLGPFGPETDLRQWGMRLQARGGKNAKKRAVVAVARKLAVLLHRLWTTGAEYVPLRGATKQTVGEAA